MQKELFSNFGVDKKNEFMMGNGLSLTLKEGYPLIAVLRRKGEVLKESNLNDKVEKKLFIIEAITLGAMKSRLASALGISRQTIDNYIDIKEHFGHEGLVRGYSLSDSKSLQTQRQIHSERTKQAQTNIIEQLTQKRREAREEKENRQLELPFKFGYNENAKSVSAEKQPFAEKHDWEKTRYAGTFIYLITLIAKWKWLQLVMGYFGDKYQIFLIFLLMSAKNIRSIEQLKNLRSREAGAVLGIKKLPIKPKIWERFYSAAEMRMSSSLISDFFRYQIHAGLVGIWLWFTDGHLLPYSGKEKIHHSFNTQRRMPVPGQTNMVTCDASGRIVDFEIQEGKGDLRSYVVDLGRKWDKDVPDGAVMVFDREGSGVEYFSRLVRGNIAFATWEKNIDTKKLLELDDDLFTKNIKYNGKNYSFFEEEKSFIYKPVEGSVEQEHSFILRRIYIWNKSSKRRTCGLSWTGDKAMSTEDCAQAILSRWGASENTFKHINDRHPLHYHPGFKMIESEKQDIANPVVKEISLLIVRAKAALNKLYKKLADAKTVTNKNGSVRKNSVKERTNKKIAEQKEKIEALQKEKKSLPERVNVSSLENYKSFKQIDNEGKNIFDFVTSSIWNARKQMVDWLRPLFNCENELIDLFYAITYCHGWVKSTELSVIVRLEPLEQKKRRTAQEQLCRKLTALGAILPTGKYLIVEVGDSPV